MLAFFLHIKICWSFVHLFTSVISCDKRLLASRSVLCPNISCHSTRTIILLGIFRQFFSAFFLLYKFAHFTEHTASFTPLSFNIIISFLPIKVSVAVFLSRTLLSTQYTHMFFVRDHRNSKQPRWQLTSVFI